jgi:anti-sigma factor RsiW
MTCAGRDRRWLHAYHDGELGPLRRWLARRRLGRDPAVRRELAALTALHGAVRGAAPDVAVPEFWGDLSGRLRAVDAELAAARPSRGGLRGLGWRRPLAAGVGLAAAAVVLLVLRTAPGPEETGGVVRWLDTRGKPVLVLENVGDATIIWLIDPAAEEARDRGVRAVL